MKRKATTMSLLFTVYLAVCVGSLLSVALFGCDYSIVRIFVDNAFTQLLFQTLADMAARHS